MISRRFVVLALVGTCILSAAVGAGVTLLVAGDGTPGAQGSTGEAESSSSGVDYGAVFSGGEGEDESDALDRTYELEDQSEELDRRLSELETRVPFALESTVGELEGDVRRICDELGIVCP